MAQQPGDPRRPIKVMVGAQPDCAGYYHLFLESASEDAPRDTLYGSRAELVQLMARLLATGRYEQMEEHR